MVLAGQMIGLRHGIDLQFGSGEDLPVIGLGMAPGPRDDRIPFHLSICWSPFPHILRSEWVKGSLVGS